MKIFLPLLLAIGCGWLSFAVINKKFKEWCTP